MSLIVKAVGQLHSFDVQPTQEDIDRYDKVIVVRKDNSIEPYFYSVENGWNTTPDDGGEHEISIESMKQMYKGWISGYKFHEEQWLDVIREIKEEVFEMRKEDPQEYESEEEQEYWNNLDELYSKLSECEDFAEALA